MISGEDLPSCVIRYTFSQPSLTYLKCHCGDHRVVWRDNVILAPSVLSHLRAISHPVHFEFHSIWLFGSSMQIIVPKQHNVL